MQTFKSQAAQGDFLITRVAALPKRAEPVYEKDGVAILAHSETGHHHVIDAKAATLYRLPEAIYEAFLVVEKAAVIEHRRTWDTHEALKVDPGIYRINRQREYVPEGYRLASD
ncbi:hypothetical protein EOI86_03835 [Hwanghaeella grinnelliae]|uniref:Uncharacterized protein n=1 Tax=Hwanghaeella grinnelliae TaxID=2500179 RepID=A0A437QVF7_9PROT|nr:hypothetical protein [Hwanghaeella grinnelliae]RVU38426.1 hypothetical protein EOI86_03835 [Hwanghaeella grinnelliae]